MSSRSVSDFEAALKQAQNQLDWGTEIKDIRDAARSLRTLASSRWATRRQDRTLDQSSRSYVALSPVISDPVSLAIVRRLSPVVLLLQIRVKADPARGRQPGNLERST